MRLGASAHGAGGQPDVGPADDAGSGGVLTLAGDTIAAITWFADTGVFPHFGLPRTLRS